MIRPLFNLRSVTAASFALAVVALAGSAPPATAYVFGSVAGEISPNDSEAYPRSISSNQLLYGAPIITTKSAAGAAMRRVRVNGIITKVRIKAAYSADRSFKFSIWRPDNDPPQFPSPECRNAVPTAAANCVMNARMTKQGEVNFVQARTWPVQDPSRSRFNSMDFGYSRVYTQLGAGDGRPTVFTFANARARVTENDWLSVAPVENDPFDLLRWRNRTIPTPGAGNLISMATRGGLCMHGAWREPEGQALNTDGGQGQPGWGGVLRNGTPRPIETGELNVGMAANRNPVFFSACYPTFQYEGYNRNTGGFTGGFYGNCEPTHNVEVGPELLGCLRAQANAMQVEYTIEPDADGDGWGDQTQILLALRERAALARDADRRAREARTQAERERLAALASAWRLTPLGVDVRDLVAEGANLNIGEVDFSLGGIAPGALPGESPADANPNLDNGEAGGGNNGGNNAGQNGGNNAAAKGPQLTVTASKRRYLGNGAIPVKVRCPKEACQFVTEAAMRSRARGASRTRGYAMRRASAVAAQAGSSRTMLVKLSESNRRKLRRAWNRRATLSAQIKVTAVNAAGGVTKKTVTVKIRSRRR